MLQAMEYEDNNNNDKVYNNNNNNDTVSLCIEDNMTLTDILEMESIINKKIIELEKEFSKYNTIKLKLEQLKLNKCIHKWVKIPQYDRSYDKCSICNYTTC